MKKIIFLLFACTALFNCFAQKEPVAPCCGIVFINPDSKIVLLRNNTTGRLLQFKPDALDIQSLKAGDAVNVSTKSSKVVSISNIARNYTLAEPDPVAPCCNSLRASAKPAEPCCTIQSINADPVAPCCTIVSVIDGGTTTFTAPNEIASHLKVGQGVFLVNNSMQAVNGTSFVADGGYAIVQTSLGALQGYSTAAYCYPVSTQSMSMNGNNNVDNNKKWTITNNTALKGAMGRLVLNYPADADWVVDIYSEPGNKFLKSFYSSEGRHELSYALMPGTYTIQINHVPVANVPIEKTSDTEIKFGILNIVTKSDWTLNDADGKNNYRNGYNEAKKLPLPPGTYKLTLGGADVPVEIKNGKTVEF